MRAKRTQSKRVNPEPGVHIARLKQIIDLGSQVDSYSGDEGRAKLEFIWELPESLHVFNEDKGEQPLIVSRKFGNTLGRGSAMKKAIESMLGHSIEKDFELDSLLDEMCNLNLSIEQDGEYENVVIQSLMPLTKDQSKKKYPTYSEAFILDLDNMDWDIYESLPDWKKEMIAKSPEYAEVAANRPAKAKQAPAKPTINVFAEKLQKNTANGKAAPAKSNAVASAKSSPFAKKATPAKGVAGKAKK